MAQLAINIFVFIIGAAIGSFLNVCIYRLPKRISVISPASSCPNCKRSILWYDNIPILSYILLRGRCRFCSGKIIFRYFLVEVLTAALVLILFLAFGLTAKFFAYAVLASCLVIATFVDFEIHEIPDEVSLGGLIAGIILSFAFPSILQEGSRAQAVLNSLVGMVVGGGTIYIMGFFGELVFRKEAMGGGDVKLMAMIGSILGWKLALVAFFMAPLFGSIVGVILKIKKGRDIIPYGPYLSLAALISIFLGERILRFLCYGLY